MGIESGFNSLYRLRRQHRVSRLGVDQWAVLDIQSLEVGMVAGDVQNHAKPSKHRAAQQEGMSPWTMDAFDVDHPSADLEAHDGRVGRFKDPGGPKPEILSNKNDAVGLEPSSPCRRPCA